MATDLVVTALVPTVPAALSLAGVEPARSIAVVVVTRLLVPTQLPALLQAEALAATDLVVTALVPMVPAAPSLAGVEPARSIAVVVVTRLLRPNPAPGPSPGGGTCGNGSRGDGACADGTCCSQFGWCGTSEEHCSGGGNPAPGPNPAPVPAPGPSPAEALAATDLVVTALVPMVPAAPSLAGVEPARSIAVVDNCNIFYHTH